jgi:hypothetical protein
MGDVSELRLHDRGLLLSERLPEEFSFLDNYQRAVQDLIVYDSAGTSTIRGLSAAHYMLRGIEEETQELMMGDERIEPGYSRMGGLLLLAGNPKAQPGLETPTAVQRHIKEFGDISWYLANYLTLFGISYSHAVTAGTLAWELDKIASPRADLESLNNVERRWPWISLFGYEKELLDTCRHIVDLRYNDRYKAEKDLIIASGKFTLAMIHIAANRFDISFQAILEGNIAKITKRRRDGTVFDKSLGEDR